MRLATTCHDRSLLDRWLLENIPAFGEGPLTGHFLSKTSGICAVRLERAGSPFSLVLHTPSQLNGTDGSNTILRQTTLLKALAGSRVPHTILLAICTNPAVIGRSFYVTEMIDGWSARFDHVNGKMSFPDEAGKWDLNSLVYAMLDGIVEMANLDFAAVGLREYGKSNSFLERQVGRWRKELESYPARYPGYKNRVIPSLEFVANWLEARVPPNNSPGLMHGDYAMNHVVFPPGRSSRLAAIIDWQTSTIGDPMLDLAIFCSNLRRKNGPQPRRPYLDPEHAPCFEDAMEYFSKKTGRSIEHIDYYVVLAKFRLACMLESKVAEAVVGLTSGEDGARFDRVVKELLAEAEMLARLA